MPQVHVSINNIPLVLRGRYSRATVQATHRNMVPNLSSSTPGPSCPAYISNQPLHTIPLSAPTPSGPTPARHVSRVLILYDCTAKRRFPTVEELLQLMDIYRPVVGKKYLDNLNEFQDMELKDITNVYSLPVELLATIGDIGPAAACRLHGYCRDKLLEPLRLLMDDGTSGSDSEGPDLGWGRDSRRQQILRWVDEVWACDEVKEAKVIAEERTETIVGTDEEEDGEMATVGSVGSCEV
jgi:hypothetical protein